MLSKIYIYKNKSASISLNSLICLNILVLIVLSTMITYQNLLRYTKSNRTLIENDYEAEIAPVCTQLNYLYSIKDAYDSTNTASGFEKYFATMERLGHRRVYSKNYYKDYRVIVKSIPNNKEVKIENESIEFSVACIYQNKLNPKDVPGKYFKNKSDYEQRYICKRCQIINPYLKYNIKNTDEKRNLSYEEIKSLFRYR